MIPKTKIEITPAMRRFNDAVEAADRETHYTFAHIPSAKRLVVELLRAGAINAANGLVNAEIDLKISIAEASL